MCVCGVYGVCVHMCVRMCECVMCVWVCVSTHNHINEHKLVYIYMQNFICLYVYFITYLFFSPYLCIYLIVLVYMYELYESKIKN